MASLVGTRAQQLNEPAVGIVILDQEAKIPHAARAVLHSVVILPDQAKIQSRDADRD